MEKEIHAKGKIDAKSGVTARPMARYICYGELFEDRKKDLSPSAQAALDEYMVDAAGIIKERREDGGIDWTKGDMLGLLRLDSQDRYNPLFVESFFSYNFFDPPILYRDEDGEIRVTDEGLKSQREEAIKALIQAEKEKPAAPKGKEEYATWIFDRVDHVYSIAAIFHSRLESIFVGRQKKTYDEVVRLYGQILHTPPFPWDAAQFPPSITPPDDSTPSKSILQNSLDGVRFASSVFVREGFRAMCNMGFWSDSKIGMPYYRPPKEKEITYLIAQKDSNGQVHALPGEEAWKIVQTLGLQTGLLHIQFAAYCMETERPWASYVHTDGDSLIKLLSLKDKRIRDATTGKQRRLSRTEQLQKLEEHLRSLRSIHVDVRSRPDRDGAIWETDEPEPLWDVSIMKKSQTIMDQAEGSSFIDGVEDLSITVDINVHVRAGRWAMHEAGSKGLYYSYLSKQILSFNTKTEEWAAKWAIFFSCFPQYEGQERRFKISTLLEAIMPEAEILLLDRQKRNETTNRLGDQLAAMEEKGWTIERSPEYLQAMGSKEGRRPRNFFPDLLESTIALTPPPVSKQIRPKEKKSLEAGTSLSGRVFKEQREKMGLSQKQAARELGRSQALISSIEKGKKSISQKDLEAWEKLRKKYYSGTRHTSDKKRRPETDK